MHPEPPRRRSGGPLLGDRSQGDFCFEFRCQLLACILHLSRFLLQRSRLSLLHLNHWSEIRGPLHAENALRVIALGRKNFLFVHSEEAGKELALLYSLVVSCTRVGVNPVEYLADVLARIDKTAGDGFADLLPDRWKPPPKRATPVNFAAA